MHTMLKMKAKCPISGQKKFMLDPRNVKIFVTGSMTRMDTGEIKYLLWSSSMPHIALDVLCKFILRKPVN